MNSLRHLLTIATAAGAFVAATSAHAISYDATSMGTLAPAGASFTPVGGSLGLKSQDGYRFLGVTGGASGNEIDKGQSITVSFSSSQVIDELLIGLLFDGPEYNDPKEIALMSVNGGYIPYALQALTSTFASWTGSGSVVNVSPALNGRGAVWKILNPFGNTAVDTLKLFPEGRTGKSDFGLVGFTTRDPHQVPDGGLTVILLGLGLATLGFFKRRTLA